MVSRALLLLVSAKGREALHSRRMQAQLVLANKVHFDLERATTSGTLRHLDLEVQPFAGLDKFGRARMIVKLATHLPAYCLYGATKLSILFPVAAIDNNLYAGKNRARVVEIAPLRWNGELFTGAFFATNDTLLHPMLLHDQVVRFDYPAEMASLQEWVRAFCLEKGREPHSTPLASLDTLDKNQHSCQR